MSKTVVLATFGKYRGHQISDLLRALQHELGVTLLETRGNTHIDVARSVLATRALDEGADVTVFIDHDMLFNPLDVQLLAEHARATRGIVGAPYSQRKPGGSIVGAAFHAAFQDTGAPFVFYEGGQLHPVVGAIGMGFTAVHRDAYELLAQRPEYEFIGSDEGPIRPFFQKLMVDGYWLKEDASFCHAVRAAGGTTHVHTAFRVQHVGDYPYSLEDCRMRVPRLDRLELKLKTSG